MMDAMSVVRPFTMKYEENRIIWDFMNWKKI